MKPEIVKKKNASPKQIKERKNAKVSKARKSKKTSPSVNSDNTAESHRMKLCHDEVTEKTSSLMTYAGRKTIVRSIISPIKERVFFKTYWETRSFAIHRCDKFYNNLLTTETLDKIIRYNTLIYTENVDVVCYENGKRETLNLEGVVYPAVLWDLYANKCSIRILNPHTYSLALQVVVGAFQEYFGCMAGCNAYLTPSGSQGFAPHYDDIEAFVLQLEGRKHWKLYAPLSEDETLPRYPSKDFNRNEIGEPYAETTLSAGDLLYFPRGIIHEGYTDADSHSLHVTISLYQKTAYVDLLEHALKSALNTAARRNLNYRRGLPIQYLQHTGFVHSKGRRSSVREEIVNNVKELMTKLSDYVCVDTAADELGKQFMWDAMPPIIRTPKECAIIDENHKFENGVVSNVSITMDSKVRLLSYHCLRVVLPEDSDDTLRVYYCTDNAKYYHGLDAQFFEIHHGLMPALEHLIWNYKQFVKVEDIPLDDDNKKKLIAELWNRGLLVTEDPLQSDD